MRDKMWKDIIKPKDFDKQEVGTTKSMDENHQ